MTEFTPTDEQVAVVDATAGKGSVMVTAYAGCAKTTTLTLASRKVKVPGLALAFNKKIAQELAGKFPGNFSVKTLNGLGYGAWMRGHPGLSFGAPDPRKLGKLVSKVARDWKVELDTEQWEACRKLIEGAMMAGIVPGDQGMPLFSDSEASWHALADEMLMVEGDFELLYPLAHETLKESISMARAGVMSFDDQIYMPTCLGGAWPKFPVLMVDEAQDLSPLNHRMLELCLRDDGRVIAVGDPKQAIYGFRGAHSESMAQIEGLRPSWTHAPLATTFRCPRSVVARQQEHAPGFRAHQSNIDGRVTRLREYDEVTLEGGWNGKDLLELLPTATSTIAVLCRNNGPLLALAFKLLRSGVPVTMMGRDIGKGLIALSRKIAPKDETPIDVVLGGVTEWLDSESSLAIANGHEEKVAGLTDKAECLRAIGGSAGVKNAGELRDATQALFSRVDGRISLGSIHRSKGLEFDVTVHLDPWRIPSKWAKAAALQGDKRQLRQEYNLRYVCETRTRHTFATANLGDFNVE